MRLTIRIAYHACAALRRRRGMSVFDVNNVLRQPSNTRLVKRLSMDAFKELLKQGVAPAAAASLSQG